MKLNTCCRKSRNLYERTSNKGSIRIYTQEFSLQKFFLQKLFEFPYLHVNNEVGGTRKIRQFFSGEGVQILSTKWDVSEKDHKMTYFRSETNTNRRVAYFTTTLGLLTQQWTCINNLVCTRCVWSGHTPNTSLSEINIVERAVQ